MELIIDKSIILLTHYYSKEDVHHRLLKHIIKNYCSYYPWDLYLYEPLKRVFPKVIVYDYMRRRADIGIQAMNEELIALVRKEHPGYVLWPSFYDDIRPSTLDIIRKEGTIVTGWFWDDEWRYDFYSKYWAPFLDYCITNAEEAVPRYRKLGSRVIQTVPNTGIAINPNWAKLEEKYPVSFVGTKAVADRKRYLGSIEKSNIDIHVFGQGSGGSISFEDMLEIFRTSKINLNFSKGGAYWPVRQIKGRMFQVCMAGGFLLTEYAPGTEDYFKIGREIVCFECAEEMIDKVRYYLDHEEERRTIARAGWKRASREYTSYHMVANVYRQIETDIAEKGKEVTSVLPKLRMHIWARLSLSRYEFLWARSLIKEGYEWRLSWGALANSLRYTPLNIWVFYCAAVGLLPRSARGSFLRVYEAFERLGIALLHRFRSSPFIDELIRKMAQKT